MLCTQYVLLCTVMYFFKLVLVSIYTQSNITKQNNRHSTITKKRKVKHFHYWGRLYQRWINRYTVDISLYIQRINFIRSENRVVRNLDSAIQRIKIHYTRQINSKFEDKTMCISRAVTKCDFFWKRLFYGMSTWTYEYAPPPPPPHNYRVWLRTCLFQIKGIAIVIEMEKYHWEVPFLL
jgi:hypothetical protein